jgi:hypothetical protein
MTVPTKKDKTMLKKFCHDQVKILLERMETHPEEFLKEGKWDEFLPPEMNAHRNTLTPRFKHFTKLEQYLVRQKYKNMVQDLLRQRAYDGILETLVFKEETNTERYYSTSNQPVLGTPPTIYEASVDTKTGKMTEKITRIKSK